MKRFLILFFAFICVFVLLTGHVDRQRSSHSRDLTEDALRRCAASCYACEGFYPADIRYLQAHYGFLYDENRYLIHYQWTASNLMPDIGVMELQP